MGKNVGGAETSAYSDGAAAPGSIKEGNAGFRYPVGNDRKKAAAELQHGGALPVGFR